MSDDALRLAVITGSTREGRFGPVVARWVVDQTAARPGWNVDAIDLRDMPLPMQQSFRPGRDGKYETPEIAAFAERIAAADAFIIVTSEYNHSFPASLKLALDSLRTEWKAKPVGFVSYGGQSGGLRAVEQLRLVVAELHMVSVRDSVSFQRAFRQFDDHGKPRDAERAEEDLGDLLDQLAWWGRILRTARASEPYRW